MDSLLKLYINAEEEGIDIVDFPLNSSKAMILRVDDTYAIALDGRKLKTLAEEKVCLAHELGHYYTGSLYNARTCAINLSVNEARANKWAIYELVPLDQLVSALKNGIVYYYELAEYFGITETFLKMAVDYYISIGVLRESFEN